MSLIPIALGIVILGLLALLWVKRSRDRADLDRHSISPEALHDLLTANSGILVYDVRVPLDFLADAEIIPGARRIAPREILENPSLIPKEKDVVVYCTCPSDETSQSIYKRARAMNFFKIKFLRGGLGAWKAKGYKVERYDRPFHLDTGA